MDPVRQAAKAVVLSATKMTPEMARLNEVLAKTPDGIWFPSVEALTAALAEGIHQQFGRAVHRQRYPVVGEGGDTCDLEAAAIVAAMLNKEE